MTDKSPGDIDIATADEVEEVLATVVETAAREGVDVRGAWEFTTESTLNRWEIEVVELVKDGEDDE